MDFFEQYQDTIALGIFLNLVTTFGFGFYKTMNIKEDEAMYLVQKYQANAQFAKLVLMWFIPFYGFLHVLKEVLKLQFSYINKGLSVFNYIEDNLKNRSDSQKN
jgi:hypothetical protein